MDFRHQIDQNDDSMDSFKTKGASISNMQFIGNVIGISIPCFDIEFHHKIDQNDDAAIAQGDLKGCTRSVLYVCHAPIFECK